MIADALRRFAVADSPATGVFLETQRIEQDQSPREITLTLS